MEWDKKVKMVEHFNNGEYKEGIDVFLASKDNLDAQAIDMFVTGMSLREEHIKLAEPCVDVLKECFISKPLSLICAVRVGAIINYFDKNFCVIKIKEE